MAVYGMHRRVGSGTTSIRTAHFSACRSVPTAAGLSLPGRRTAGLYGMFRTARVPTIRPLVKRRFSARSSRPPGNTSLRCRQDKTAPTSRCFKGEEPPAGGVYHGGPQHPVRRISQPEPNASTHGSCARSGGRLAAPRSEIQDHPSCPRRSTCTSPPVARSRRPLDRHAQGPHGAGDRRRLQRRWEHGHHGQHRRHRSHLDPVGEAGRGPPRTRRPAP